MNIVKNCLSVVSNMQVEQHVDIIDDVGLIDDVIKLNFLRESANGLGLDFDIALKEKERELAAKVDHINAEMRWFSQWLSLKSSSAA